MGDVQEDVGSARVSRVVPEMRVRHSPVPQGPAGVAAGHGGGSPGEGRRA